MSDLPGLAFGTRLEVGTQHPDAIIHAFLPAASGGPWSTLGLTYDDEAGTHLVSARVTPDRDAFSIGVLDRAASATVAALDALDVRLEPLMFFPSHEHMPADLVMLVLFRASAAECATHEARIRDDIWRAANAHGPSPSNWLPSGPLISAWCMSCRHYRTDDVLCAAYPAMYPFPFVAGQTDHPFERPGQVPGFAFDPIDPDAPPDLFTPST